MKISGLWNVNVNTVKGSFKWYLLYTYWGRKTLEGLFAAVKYINLYVQIWLERFTNGYSSQNSNIVPDNGLLPSMPQAII